jgi:hypothetical protein
MSLYVTLSPMQEPARRCDRGHAMRVTDRFRFDDEPGDSAHDSDALARFRAMGIEMGADVTVWYCDACDFATAEFVYPDKPQ